MKTDREIPNLADTSKMQKSARLAGFLYLISILIFIFAAVFGRQKLIVWGNAAATANQILTHEWLFRIGFVADIVSALFFLLAAWALYVLLKAVDQSLALLFVLLNLCGVAMQCLNDLNLLAALMFLSGADYLRVFPAGQQQALAMLFLNLHQDGFMMAQIFYGAWLLPLGYLVYKSGFLPRLLGILLMIDCFGVLIWFVQFFLFPRYAVITYPFLAESFIAEAGLTLWLLFKGAKVAKMQSAN